MTLTLKEARRKYYAKNKERIIAKSAQYYRENKPKVLEQRKVKYRANPQSTLVYTKQWAKNHPEKRKEIMKTWLTKHPDKRKILTRNSRIRAYGIEPEIYLEMLEKQEHKCAICGAESKHRAMNIDHDHKTGKVRGLLCDGCNLSLGHIERDGFMEKALAYIAKYK